MVPIWIDYRLSEAGQRASLKAGGNGDVFQTIAVKHGEPEYAEAAGLAQSGSCKGKDGNYYTHWYIDMRGNGGFFKPPGSYDHYDLKCLGYDEPPTVRKLLDDYADLCIQHDMAKGAAQVKEESRKQAEIDAILAAGEEGRLYCAYNEWRVLSERCDDPRVKQLIDAATATANSRNVKRRAEEEERTRKVAAEKSEKGAKEESERRLWVAAYGSDRLKRMVEEEIECQRTYLDERLLLERPGWRWVLEVDGEAEEPRNPPESAFTILDAARAIDPEAVLQRWVVKHKHDENCCAQDECDKYDSTAYVAVGEFLGRGVIYGV